MGLFDGLFGPSIKERMQPYFEGPRQPFHERISRCVREMQPTVRPGDITAFYEAGAELTRSPDGSNEARALFSACAARAGMRCIAITMQKGSDPDWRVIVNSDSVGTAVRPAEQLRYGKYRNRKSGVQVWMCLYDDGTQMMDLATGPEWEMLA
jgi:hypothetical protein